MDPPLDDKNHEFMSGIKSLGDQLASSFTKPETNHWPKNTHTHTPFCPEKSSAPLPVEHAAASISPSRPEIRDGETESRPCHIFIDLGNTLLPQNDPKWVFPKIWEKPQIIHLFIGFSMK